MNILHIMHKIGKIIRKIPIRQVFPFVFSIENKSYCQTVLNAVGKNKAERNALYYINLCTNEIIIYAVFGNNLNVFYQ